MPKKISSLKTRVVNLKKCIPPKTLQLSSKIQNSPPLPLYSDRHISNCDRYNPCSIRYNNSSAKTRYASNNDCDSSNKSGYDSNSDRYNGSNGGDRYFSNDDLTDEDDLDAKPVQRNAANARERARMRILSKAFFRLKTNLPWVSKGGHTRIGFFQSLGCSVRALRKSSTCVGLASRLI